MKTFDVKSLELWTQLVHGSAINCPVGPAGGNIEVEFNTSDRVEIYAVPEGDTSRGFLLAASEGLFSVRARVGENVDLVVYTDEETAVYYKGNTRTHQVQLDEKEVFTTLEPMNRRNTEFDRLMMAIKLNEQARDQRLAKELAEIRATQQPVAAPEQLQTPEEKEKTTDEPVSTSADVVE